MPKPPLPATLINETRIKKWPHHNLLPECHKDFCQAAIFSMELETEKSCPMAEKWKSLLIPKINK